jgi:hypothetical protein
MMGLASATRPGAAALLFICTLLLCACCPLLVAADGTCSSTRLNGSSFHGDLGTASHATTTADACCQACASASNCTIWTLGSDKLCYLRSNSAGAHPFANPKAVSGYTSDYTPPPPHSPPPPPSPSPPPPHYPPIPPLAPPPNPCKSCRGPTWTWDVFPAFFHSADSGSATNNHGGFTEDALQTITKFVSTAVVQSRCSCAAGSLCI